MIGAMATCPRCGLAFVDAEACPECGVALVDDRELRLTAGAHTDSGRFVVVAELLDPFEGGLLVDLLESRRIPVVIREGTASGWMPLPMGPRWGHLLVPEGRFAEARGLVETLRADIEAAGSIPEALSPDASLVRPRGAPEVAPARGRLEVFTGGGPKAVLPFHRFGWIFVERGRLGPGGRLEGRVTTTSRLVKTCALGLRLETEGAEPEEIARTEVDLPEAGSAVFTLVVPAGAPRPDEEDVLYTVTAVVRGRIHILATGAVPLAPAPRVPARRITGRE